MKEKKQKLQQSQNQTTNQADGAQLAEGGSGFS